MTDAAILFLRRQRTKLAKSIIRSLEVADRMAVGWTRDDLDQIVDNHREYLRLRAAHRKQEEE